MQNINRPVAKNLARLILDYWEISLLTKVDFSYLLIIFLTEEVIIETLLSFPRLPLISFQKQLAPGIKNFQKLSFP